MIAATKLGREMKRRHQAGEFGIEILHPGLADNAGDSGIGALGRIDHARVGEGTVVRMHPHKDDEILTYLRGGRVRHQDTEGHLEEISATRLMMMNAGRSFQHEETVIDGPLTGLQIFLRPHAPDLDPMVQFHDFGTAHSVNEWRLIAGPRDAPLTVRGEVQAHFSPSRRRDAHWCMGSHAPIPSPSIRTNGCTRRLKSAAPSSATPTRISGRSPPHRNIWQTHRAALRRVPGYTTSAYRHPAGFAR